MRTHMTCPLGWALSIILACCLGLVTCDDSDPTGPLKRPPEPLLNLGIGTYWVYVDSVWGEDSITVRTDTVSVTDTVRDSLGFRWILSEDMPWLHREVALLADTIATVELGSGGLMLVQQFLPPQDTPYVFRVVIGDLVLERRVQWVDTSIQTLAGTFDSTIAYRGGPELNVSHNYVLAPGIGFVLAEVASRPEYAGVPQRWRSWLVKYELISN